MYIIILIENRKCDKKYTIIITGGIYHDRSRKELDTYFPW